MMQACLLVVLSVIICQAEHHLEQLTLMTYNVMLLPSILIFERDQLTRANLLTKAKFLRTSDILCLQEVFQLRPSTILLDALAETYTYSTPVLGDDADQDQWNKTWNSPIGTSPLKFVSGGVTILSKWPIVYAEQYFFKHSCSAHTFVRTGFVYSTIVYGEEKSRVHVFGTHLQPNDYRGCFLYGEAKTREQQMTELDEFIQSKNISHDELVFILGDFNVNKYHREQYKNMLRILNVQPQQLYPSSLTCSWDSSYNAMTNSKHENQLLDYIFLHRRHTPHDAQWLNLITDRMASQQWHLLGRNRSYYDSRNIPLLELSDHYPVIGFFQRNPQTWPHRSSGVLTYVQLFTADTNLPVIIVDRDIHIADTSNRSAQYVLLIDRHRPEFYLSDEKFLRMKYGKEHVNRYLRIIHLNTTAACITSNTTVIFQSRSSTGFDYIRTYRSQLCACTKDKHQAQAFRFIEVERRNISCTISIEN
jgi:sphingomyelin phosphodiesterase